MAAVWFGLGLRWRQSGAPAGAPRRAPPLFFIPLPILALPPALLAVSLFFVELSAGRRPIDPRAAQLRADERTLDQSRLGGEVELSEGLARDLAAITTAAAKADDYHVFTRATPEKVLVLVKVPNLKKYKESARVQLVGAIADLLSERDQLQGKQLYIGVKGQLTFGAIRVPPDLVKTGSVLSASLLYDFYGPKPTASARSKTPS
ncbi:MAG: hypothetical protein IRY99_24605 [Isosphaeraceae bacterium]|nr:hypothetical protein [Isosphaeraceae bacterium]